MNPRKRIERNISYDEVRKKYYVVFNFGKDPVTGEQIKPYKTFDKLKDARAALRQHEAARDRGQVVMPKEMTLRQWLDTWMQNIVELECADTTVYGYRQMIRNHIAPALGDIPLQKLTTQQVQGYYSEKIRAGTLSSNTVRKHHDLLNRALKVAVKQGLILSNPAQNAEAPRTVRPDINYYSLEDVQKLLQLALLFAVKYLKKQAANTDDNKTKLQYFGCTWLGESPNVLQATLQTGLHFSAARVFWDNVPFCSPPTLDAPRIAQNICSSGKI